MTTREEWLTKAKDLIVEQVFAPHEIRLCPVVRLSVGPCPGKSLGVCFSPDSSDDGACNIFVTPEYGGDNVMEILGILTHELVHCALFSDGHDTHGHGPLFKNMAKQVGLEGRAKSATCHEGTELWATLSGVATALGEYPMGPLRKKPKKTRVSEMLTWVSESNPEYEVKAKFTLTYEHGVPRDGAGVPMVPKDKEKWSELEEWYLSDKSEEEAEAAE